MTTVRELREQLKELGLSDEIVNNIKGKKRLEEKIKELQNLDDSEIQIILEEDNPKDLSKNNDITINDVEWTNYVLSLLDNSEKSGGYPTVNGLRRVANMIYEIVSSETKVIQAPNLENNCIATVQHDIEYIVSDIITKRYSGVADAYSGNTEPPFSRHLSATAETRAEGRALRRLLRLNTLTAEEMQEESRVAIQSEVKTTDTQITGIDMVCKRLDVNVENLVKQLIKKKVKTIKQISHNEALSVIEQLNRYQTETDEIPEQIKSYDSEWQSEFNR